MTSQSFGDNLEEGPSILQLDDLCLSKIISFLNVQSFHSLAITCNRMNLLCKSSKDWNVSVLLRRIKYLIFRALLFNSVNMWDKGSADGDDIFSTSLKISDILGQFLNECRLFSLQLKIFSKIYSTSMATIFGPVGLKFYSYLEPTIEDCPFFPQNRESISSMYKLNMPSKQIITLSYFSGLKVYTISLNNKTLNFYNKDSFNGDPLTKDILDLLSKEVGPTHPNLSSNFVYHLLEFFIHGSHTCEYPMTLFTELKIPDLKNQNSVILNGLSCAQHKYFDCIDKLKIFTDAYLHKQLFTKYFDSMNEFIDLISMILLKYQLTHIEAIEQMRLVTTRFMKRLLQHNYIDKETVYTLLMRVDFGSLTGSWNNDLNTVSCWKTSVKFHGCERNIIKIDGEAGFMGMGTYRTFKFSNMFGTEISEGFTIQDDSGNKNKFVRKGDPSKLTEIFQKCISEVNNNDEKEVTIGDAFTTVFCLMTLDRVQFVPGVWYYHRWGLLMAELTMEKRGLAMEDIPKTENYLFKRESRSRKLFNCCKCY